MSDSPTSEWIPCKEKKSTVWNYFLQNAKDCNRLKCKKCSAIFTNQRATTSYRYHLQHVHGIDITFSQSEPKENTERSKSIQPSIAKFCKPKEPTEKEILADLAAIDRISFATLAKSKQLHHGWNKQGLQMPTSPTGVRNVVVGYAKEKKQTLTQVLTALSQQNVRFSLSLDEYTSIKNRRYMNINVHSDSGRFYGLGVVRIHGSLKAEDVYECVQSRVKEFGLDLDRDIVATTTDGAALMLKFGRLTSAQHQVCHAHGLHLSVSDILYKAQNQERVISDSEDEDSESFEVALEEEDPVRYGIDEAENFAEVIKKVRKIVNLFRRSPVKNDHLQSVIRALYGKEKQLYCDVRTRWNSLIKMIQGFLEVKEAISVSLRKFEQEDRFPSESEISLLEHLIEPLEIIEAGALKLGQRDCDLYKADKIFRYMLRNLQSLQGQVGKDIYQSVKKRIEERRHVKLSCLFWYFHQPDEYLKFLEKKDKLLRLLGKNDLWNFATSLYIRLFPIPLALDGDGDSDVSSQEFENEEPVTKKCRKEELEDFLAEEVTTDIDRSDEADVFKMVKKECAVLEASGDRANMIKKLYDALKTVVPSSVESERAFSAVGLFATKLRTSLNDETVDSLVFLRTTLLHEQK